MSATAPDRKRAHERAPSDRHDANARRRPALRRLERRPRECVRRDAPPDRVRPAAPSRSRSAKRSSSTSEAVWELSDTITIGQSCGDRPRRDAADLESPHRLTRSPCRRALHRCPIAIGDGVRGSAHDRWCCRAFASVRGRWLPRTPIVRHDVPADACCSPGTQVASCVRSGRANRTRHLSDRASSRHGCCAVPDGSTRCLLDDDIEDGRSASTSSLRCVRCEFACPRVGRIGSVRLSTRA